MPKIRIHELAKELNVDNKAVMDYLKENRIEVKSHMSTLEDNQEAMVRKGVFQPGLPGKDEKTGGRPQKKPEAPKKKNIIQVFRPQNATTKEARNSRRFQERPARKPAVPSTGSAEGNRTAPGSGKRKGKSSFSGARRGPRPEPGEATDSSRRQSAGEPGNPAPRLLLQVPASARTARATEARAAALSATAREEAETDPREAVRETEARAAVPSVTAREEAGTDPREAVRETEARAAVLLATVRTVRETAPVFRDGRTAEAMTAEEGLTAGAEVPEAIGRESPRRLWISA